MIFDVTGVDELIVKDPLGLIGLLFKDVDVFVTNLFDRRAETYRYAECNALVCGPLTVYHGIYRPRTVGLKFAQKF